MPVNKSNIAHKRRVMQKQFMSDKAFDNQEDFYAHGEEKGKRQSGGLFLGNVVLNPGRILQTLL